MLHISQMGYYKMIVIAKLPYIQKIRTNTIHCVTIKLFNSFTQSNSPGKKALIRKLNNSYLKTGNQVKSKVLFLKNAKLLLTQKFGNKNIFHSNFL